MTLKSDAKFREKLTYRFKTDMRSLTNFGPEHTKVSRNLHFNGFFLTKVYNVWAKKLQKSYIWQHWRLMQNMKENWLELSKMTWGIWQVFTGWKIAISLWKVKWRIQIKIKTQNKKIDQMQCENFILTWKWINSTINKTFLHMFYKIVVLKV